jgi:hypothetical protein
MYLCAFTVDIQRLEVRISPPSPYNVKTPQGEGLKTTPDAIKIKFKKFRGKPEKNTSGTGTGKERFFQFKRNEY